MSSVFLVFRDHCRRTLWFVMVALGRGKRGELCPRLNGCRHLLWEVLVGVCPRE